MLTKYLEKKNYILVVSAKHLIGIISLNTWQPRPKTLLSV